MMVDQVDLKSLNVYKFHLSLFLNSSFHRYSLCLKKLIIIVNPQLDLQLRNVSYLPTCFTLVNSVSMFLSSSSDFLFLNP